MKGAGIEPTLLQNLASKVARSWVFPTTCDHSLRGTHKH